MARDRTPVPGNLKPGRNVPETGFDPHTLEGARDSGALKQTGEPGAPPPPNQAAERGVVPMAGEKSLKFAVDRPGTMKAAGGFRIDYSKESGKFSVTDPTGGSAGQYDTVKEAEEAAGKRMKDLRAVGLIEDEKR